MNNFFPLNGTRKRSFEISSQPTTQFNIFPRIAYSRVENNDYYMTFQNFCSTMQITPGLINVDQTALKRKLEAWVRPEDRKYIKLVSFNTNKSVFKFDVDVWLNDVFKGTIPSTNVSTFTKSYRFTKQLPYMVRVYGLTYLYEKHVAEKFRAFLKKQPDKRESVFSMITNITGKTLGLDKLNMFEYTYNWQSNTINVNLKPIYFASVLAAASMYLKKKNTKKLDFDKSVMKFLKIC